MNIKILILIFFISIIYMGSYFCNRSVSVSAYTATVSYAGHGYREYILDDPSVEDKLESGTYDLGGKPSILIRIYRPIEILEMKIRFKLKHY